MKKQTAVEWLFAHLLPFLEFSDPKEREHFRKCLAEAKAMENEQIIEAFDEGQEYEYQYHINSTPKFDSQTYFNETYGGEK
jgi:hypothetical protein